MGDNVDDRKTGKRRNWVKLVGKGKGSRKEEWVGERKRQEGGKGEGI